MPVMARTPSEHEAWLARTVETVLEPELPIVDPHHHLWTHVQPPYLLEVHLHDPAPCWCRLELVPEAGGTIVSLTVAGVAGEAPTADEVRDLWVASLNTLGSAP